MTLRVRALSEDEAQGLARMTRSHKLGAGLVRRAQIVQHAVDGLSAPEIATRMDLCGATVRFWLNRFNERGLLGLEEDMRSGRPPTYSAEERSAVIAAALSRPAELDLPFASWTLDRLVVHLGEQGIGMRRSRVSEILLAKPAGPRAERAKQEIACSRRDVAGYVFGALQPATGAALTQTDQGRTTANWVGARCR